MDAADLLHKNRRNTWVNGDREVRFRRTDLGARQDGGARRKGRVRIRWRLWSRQAWCAGGSKGRRRRRWRRCSRISCRRTGNHRNGHTLRAVHGLEMARGRIRGRSGAHGPFASATTTIIAATGNGTRPVRSHVTFRALAAEWQVLPMYKSSTQKNHRHILGKHLLPRFGDKAIAEITRQEVSSVRQLVWSATGTLPRRPITFTMS